MYNVYYTMNKTTNIFIHPFSTIVLDAMMEEFHNETKIPKIKIHPHQYKIMYNMWGMEEKMAYIYNKYYEKELTTFN